MNKSSVLKLTLVFVGTLALLGAIWFAWRPSSISTSPDETDMSQSACKKTHTGIPPGYSSEIMNVKFREGTDIDQPEELLPADLRESVARIRRHFTLSDEELDKMGAGEFKLWFDITLKPCIDAAAFLEELRELESVEIAEPAPLPASLP
jgi:hypothetical protein